MLKKTALILATLLCVFCMNGCAAIDSVRAFLTPQDVTPNLPGRMVESLDIALYPYDPAFRRHYHTEETLNHILDMVRDMTTKDTPQTAPDLKGGQSYYVITVNYPGGTQEHYYLLGYRFLKVGSEPWCEVSFDSARNLAAFFQGHSSDDTPHPYPHDLPPSSEYPATEW